MDRRALLAIVAGLAGCSEGPSATTGTADETSTTPATTTTGTVTPCSPAQTEFQLPVETRPDPLDAGAARQVAADLEGAYFSELDVYPRLFPQLPDGVESLSFSLADPGALATESVADGYRVTVHGTATYRRAFDETPTTVTERLDVAIYLVTRQQVARVRGIGDLTGTVICW